jgi:two-component system, cell cycle sensor histidine kinase and response regulator CckA
LTFTEGGSPHLATVSLPQIIHDACEAALQGSNVTCQYFISEGLSPVSADEVQLAQVLTNLVINARRAMPEGGIVKIKACNISRCLPPETREINCVQIAVEDMGAGMPEAELGNIFDSCLKTGDGGFGLRLSLSYSIISKHGGIVEAQSIPGAGNIFYVYLPVVGLASSAGQTKLNSSYR